MPDDLAPRENQIRSSGREPGQTSLIAKGVHRKRNLAGGEAREPGCFGRMMPAPLLVRRGHLYVNTQLLLEVGVGPRAAQGSGKSPQKFEH